MEELQQEISQLRKQLSQQAEQLLDAVSLLNAKKAEIIQKDELIAEKEAKIQKQSERILILERQIYGRRSEKRLPSTHEGQLNLFLALEGNQAFEESLATVKPIIEEIEQRAKARRVKKQANPQPRVYVLSNDIERVETIVEPQGVDLSTMVMIGTDVTEALECTPSKFYVNRTVRPIYRPKQVNKEATSTPIYQAPRCNQVLPGSYAGASLLSQIIIIDKYTNHIPEYRQCERFKSYGIKLPTTTVNRWVHAAADKLHPLYHALSNYILKQIYIQVDESTISVTDKVGKSRKGYIWCVHAVRQKSVFFYWDKGSRSGKVVNSLLKKYQGAVQVDGYAGYSIFEHKQGVLLLGCLAHVRRNFEQALKQGYETAAVALDFIATLYSLESNLKEQKASEQEIAKQRIEKAYPILQTFEKWMLKEFEEINPKSKLGEAIKYAFGMLPRICRYCSDGSFEIDNNKIENLIRPIALGRKNYLFVGNNSSAEDTALFYSLLGTCKLNDVDPLQWLTYVLKNIDSHQGEAEISKLLPFNWGK